LDTFLKDRTKKTCRSFRIGSHIIKNVAHIGLINYPLSKEDSKPNCNMRKSKRNYFAILLPQPMNTGLMFALKQGYKVKNKR
jgi:hypothetical protein